MPRFLPRGINLEASVASLTAKVKKLERKQKEQDKKIELLLKHIKNLEGPQ